MFAVVFRILLRAAFTLLLLTACVFFGLHMTGDPARIMLGNAADEVALEAFRASGASTCRSGSSSSSTSRSSSRSTWARAT